MEIHVYSTPVYVQVEREERQPTQTKLTMNMHVYTRTPTTKLTTHLRTQGSMPSIKLEWWIVSFTAS